jgi:GTP-binding protein SAR1
VSYRGGGFQFIRQQIEAAIEKMWEWFYNFLVWIGFYNKSATVMFAGLDNAGKTTLMRVMAQNRVVVHEPTQRPTMEEFLIGNLTCQVIDMGGHDAVRRLWLDYAQQADAVVFLVDAADPSRFAEARIELNKLLEDASTASLPFLILGNKVDLPHAVSEDRLRQELMLTGTTGKDMKRSECVEGQRVVELFMGSVVKRAGLSESFEWLTRFLD